MQHHLHPSAPLTAPTSRASSCAPGQRSGQGADSALPGLHEDGGQRPGPLPERRDAGAAGDAVPGPSRVGKYLVSPLVRAVDNGWFTSSVSIRSGTGSATTDRVLRLSRLFLCAKEAANCASDEAMRWIAAAHRPAAA